MKKFKRAGRHHKNITDGRGTVIIKVYLAVPNKGQNAVKGNIIRTIPVHDSTVTEVTAAIDSHLF